ncbi:MAG: glycosyltransferase family 4 protein [bacterium]|nr:glycosyltransferase family 4 protein [bacterium]MDZ4285535.1 glycosyltransferase family 4 protein [Candidatus Sungbacteria bacterium]
MKIAVIQSRLNGRGGSQRQTIGYARAFKKLGHDVMVYAITYEKDRCFPEMCEGLKVVSLPDAFVAPVPITIPFLGFLNYLRYSRAESRAAKHLSFLIDPETDVLHAHDRLGFRVAAYYKQNIKNIPSVLMMNDILTKSWSAWRKSQFDPALAPRLKQRVFNWVFDAYEVRKYIHPHEGMTTLDIRTRDWARVYFHKKAICVRSGLDIGQFPFIVREGCRGRRVRVLVAGVFFLHRRYEDAVRAIKIICDQGYDATLSVLGNYISNNEYRAYQKRLALLGKELGIENRIVFTGEVSEEDLRRAYQTHDVYVSPNHLQSFGLAAFEAMASGTPVVISNTAGASEILTNKENALIVDAKSPDQIAAAIKKLADDPVFYQTISKTGRLFAEKNVSWERVARETIKVFEGLVHGG